MPLSWATILEVGFLVKKNVMKVLFYLAALIILNVFRYSEVFIII